MKKHGTLSPQRGVMIEWTPELIEKLRVAQQEAQSREVATFQFSTGIPGIGTVELNTAFARHLINYLDSTRGKP